MTRSINWIVAASALALALATIAAPAQAYVGAIAAPAQAYVGAHATR